MFMKYINKIKSIFLGSDINNDSKFSIFEVIIIIFISLILGIIIGYIITFTRDTNGENSNSKLSELITTYYSIKDNYYKEINDDELVDSAIEGMIKSLGDENSVFMNSSSSRDFTTSVNGSYVGIGVSINNEDGFYHISEIYSKSPAEKAGLKVGDIIIEIDDDSLEDKSIEEVSSLIAGKVGSYVKLKIKRDDIFKKYSVKRDNIEIKSVYGNIYEVNDKLIGYIQIKSFSSNTYEQFASILNDFEEKNISSLVLDVRDNLGGQLTQVRQILSMFFNKKTVLYRTKYSNNIKKVYSSTNSTRSYPVAIIMNSMTASASEVLVTCFKENYNNVFLIGEKTYGKGTIQKSKTLTTGSTIKYTIYEWLTSKGNNINSIGIEPDYYVEQSLEYYQDKTYDNDLQLQEAINRIK